MNFMMTDEEFINYCMSMHYLTPDQKLIFFHSVTTRMVRGTGPYFVWTPTMYSSEEV